MLQVTKKWGIWGRGCGPLYSDVESQYSTAPPHIDIRSSHRKTADAVQADNPKEEGVISFLYKYMDVYVCEEETWYSIDGMGIGTVFQIGTTRSSRGAACVHVHNLRPVRPRSASSVTPARCKDSLTHALRSSALYATSSISEGSVTPVEKSIWTMRDPPCHAWPIT